MGTSVTISVRLRLVRSNWSGSAALTAVTVDQRCPAMQFAVTSNGCMDIYKSDLLVMSGGLIRLHKEVLLKNRVTVAP